MKKQGLWSTFLGCNSTLKNHLFVPKLKKYFSKMYKNKIEKYNLKIRKVCKSLIKKVLILNNFGLQINNFATKLLRYIKYY